MKLIEINDNEFNQFVEKYNLSSIYQTAEYGLVMTNQNFQSLCLALIDDNNIIVAATLVLVEKLGKFKYAYAPRGYLIDYTNMTLLTEFTNQLKNYLKKLNIIAIKICPMVAKNQYNPKLGLSLTNPSYDTIFNNLKELKYYHLGYNNFFESLKPRYEAIIELNKNTNNMFNDLNENYKEKIKAGDLLGIRIYKGNENNLDYIYQQMRDKKAKSKEYVEDMFKHFSKSDKVEIFFAQLETKTFLINTQIEYQKQINVCNEVTDLVFKDQGKADNELLNKKISEDNKLAALKRQLVYATNTLRDYPDGVIVAGAMIIKHNNKAYLTLDGYDATFKNLCPKHLLIWKLMEKYALEGFTELNLGGMTNPTLENNKFKNLNEFKLNFNAKCVEYAGDFELVTNLPLYTLYRNGAPIRKILKK